MAALDTKNKGEAIRAVALNKAQEIRSKFMECVLQKVEVAATKAATTVGKLSCDMNASEFGLSFRTQTKDEINQQFESIKKFLNEHGFTCELEWEHGDDGSDYGHSCAPHRCGPRVVKISF